MVVIVLILGMVNCNSPTVEPQPGFNPDPDNIRSSTANNGMVVATQSSEAVEAGVAALKAGGSAADAALVTALAQVPLLPGNFITYAGILHMLYYEAETGRVYSINASWDIPRDELDPLSIPRINLQSIDPSKHSGRSALVPGFMAGVGAIHERFGKLPFAELLEPAIAYAERGVVIDEMQAQLFLDFETVLSRLPETRALFSDENGKLYEQGDLLKQPELADTLRSVAEQGVDYMYTGAWGEKFVETIQREGGVISMEDMAAYDVIWTDPAHTTYRDYDIYAPGLPGFGGVSALEAFNLFNEAGMYNYEHFSTDPDALFWLMQITRVNILDFLSPKDLQQIFPGRDLSHVARLNKETSTYLWEQIRQGQFPFTNLPAGAGDTHSAAVLAIDPQGNIAAMVHTSNAYFYGQTGISVDGVYIPDAAANQQERIALAGAGNRLPDPINPMIILRDGFPVAASSCIGSIHRESMQRLESMLDHNMSPQEALASPQIMSPQVENDGILERVLDGTFAPQILQAVQGMGQPVEELPATFDNLILNTGVWIGIEIDQQTGTINGAAPGLLGGYAGGY
jgi:gamma-glutamyltranspeptidase/glutathione hydrolase